MPKTKIYIICPEIKVPTGGVKQLYKLAELLSGENYDVFLTHGKKNFKNNWFSAKVQFAYFPNLFYKIYKLTRKNKRKYIFKDFFKELFMDKSLPEKDSILIFPEVWGANIHTLTPNKYIVYNQNCYYTFNLFPFLNNVIEHSYDNTNFLGFLTVSQDSKEYLNLAFPNQKTEPICLGLNPSFSFSSNKEKIIAFMPRKLKEDFNQIHQILVNNPHFKDWKWQPIDNCTEDEVATILQKSAIFLSFNYNEGFGLPPVEAMACGCYVIGYAGNAGKEYFLSEFSTIVADRNIIEYTKVLLDKVITFNENPLSLINLGKEASVYVHKTYNLAHEKQSTLNAVNNILKNEIPI
ncbi:glycosyltransferase [Paenimyroides baculatum]|uniref:Glycosyltransferase family 4 protein n=1 Tax=Paenimyroides baculatum TaxID=2608000 RepID=A0A5M6CLF3_9FLAO|nr:glycosyltransferase [Paenimyroides baculatum]KAA5535827.1 glycosyltransferase family 4 protein [Paenimyroides baculatum]